MERLTDEERGTLIIELATRAGTGKQIASWYGMTIEELRAFADEHWRELHAARDRANAALAAAESDDSTMDLVTPTQLDELWISNKFDRLLRLQTIADDLFNRVKKGHSIGADYATDLREFRSYCVAAANELGQLLHRGSGENNAGDTLAIDIAGIDMDSMR
jgi:hypothetical protein